MVILLKLEARCFIFPACLLEKLILFPFMKKKKPFKTTHYLLWNYRAVGKLNILGVINNQRLFEKQCFALNVAVEVLFIEISLKSAIWRLYFHPAKFDNFKDEKVSGYKLSYLHKAKTCWTENLLKPIH